MIDEIQGDELTSSVASDRAYLGAYYLFATQTNVQESATSRNTWEL